MEVYAANVDGTELRNLSQDSYADDHGPVWSPWGGRIAYYSNRDGGWDIYTLDLASGQRANVTQSDMLEQAPHWGP
jgi:TolB protein